MRTIRNVAFLILCASFVISRTALTRASEEDSWCDSGYAYLEVASDQCGGLDESTCSTLCGPGYCGGCGNGRGVCSDPLWYDKNLYPFQNPSGGWARNYECFCACDR
jgi:hypothetical protein